MRYLRFTLVFLAMLSLGKTRSTAQSKHELGVNLVSSGTYDSHKLPSSAFGWLNAMSYKYHFSDKIAFRSIIKRENYGYFLYRSGAMYNDVEGVGAYTRHGASLQIGAQYEYFVNRYGFLVYADLRQQYNTEREFDNRSFDRRNSFENDVDVYRENLGFGFCVGFGFVMNLNSRLALVFEPQFTFMRNKIEEFGYDGNTPIENFNKITYDREFIPVNMFSINVKF